MKGSSIENSEYTCLYIEDALVFGPIFGQKQNKTWTLVDSHILSFLKAKQTPFLKMLRNTKEHPLSQSLTSSDLNFSTFQNMVTFT